MRLGSLTLASVAALSALALTACGDESSPQTGDPDNVEEGSTCTATLRILQKDAYKESAGRTSDLWPPHTTTVYEIACDGETQITSVQANHGTEPGKKDAAGNVILVETAVFDIDGTEDELLDLGVAFEACSCDSETTFLSLDSLEDTVAQDLVAQVAAYMDANLSCPTIGTEQLIGWLQEGAIDQVLATLPSCSWVDGSSLEDGLDEAMTALIASTGETLAGYHVCNNDAALQVGLVEGFLQTGKVQACDATSNVCKSPLWLYAPEAPAAD